MGIKVHFNVSAAKQAIGNSNADEQKVNKLPELGEYGLVDKFRSLRREQRNSNKKKEKEERLTEDLRVGFMSGVGRGVCLKLLR